MSILDLYDQDRRNTLRFVHLRFKEMIEKIQDAATKIQEVKF
ncbi:unnamed protein product [Paramecium octaurelia]|uniref:Uncharacterized protein n=1 Tax=Paramecium octaurelia TaxID=43137 RepID=A0A8S1W3W1_PAROT|nr:unnamed protein product [Paramecium octaurelia]